jgi:H+/Cl- antiporter ClcA
LPAAVVVATVVRGFILGTGPIFPVVAHITEIPWSIDLLAIVIGLCGAAVAVAATRLVYLAEDLFARLPFHWMWWPAIGGLVIGVGGSSSPGRLASATT